MPAPYSYDLRIKVIEAIDEGMGKTQASKIFKISIYGFTEEKKQGITELRKGTNKAMRRKLLI